MVKTVMVALGEMHTAWQGATFDAKLWTYIWLGIILGGLIVGAVTENGRKLARRTRRGRRGKVHNVKYNMYERM
jgi:hypothetical protein